MQNVVRDKIRKGLPRWCRGKEPTCQQADIEARVQSLGWGDPLQWEMAIHSKTLAWKIP